MYRYSMKKDDLKKTFSEMGLKSQAKLLDDLEAEHARASGTPAPKNPRKVHGSGKALPRPFLKWAGGKARMVQHIIDVLPESFRTYYEPFLGGGAIFFELARRKAFKKAVLADANADLIACYIAIRDDVDGVLEELSKPEYGYDKKKYLTMRARVRSGPTEDAARFIYLNRTCFNGLYRVNRSGGFNVPFGAYSNPMIRDERTLRAASEALHGVTLLCCDFEVALKGVKKGDVVYIDPPYAPTSNTSNFTSYTESGFSEEDHRRLAARFSKLAWSGISTVLSNSSVPLTAELYGKWGPVSFSGARNIGGPASYRGSATEILVVANGRTLPVK